jgi:pre-mRNA-splicing factor ISY1
MLYRFRQQQAADMGIVDLSARRPKNITSVTSIPQAEKWRSQLVRDISRKISKIQEPSLSEYQIRDVNDEINRMMREKHVWEIQIKNLGGPNYMRGGGKFVDDQGRAVPGTDKGYRYYGRARDLPGVKELFEAAAKGPERYEKSEQSGPRLDWKGVDAAYYGYNLDEEDGTLLEYEQRREEEATAKLRSSGQGKAPKDWEPIPGDTGDGVGWQLPTVEDVQEELMNRRRKKLLDRLGS